MCQTIVSLSPLDECGPPYLLSLKTSFQLSETVFPLGVACLSGLYCNLGGMC